MRLAQAQLVELADGALGHEPLRLVGGKHDGPARAAQQIGDVPVLVGQPLPGIDEKDDDVGLGDRLPRLPGHLVQDAVLRDGFEPARVDDEERLLTDAGAAVVPVARQAREIGDERGAGSGQPVEERRLADVRAPDDDYGGQHRSVPARPPEGHCAPPRGAATRP